MGYFGFIVRLTKSPPIIDLQYANGWLMHVILVSET